MSYVGEDTGCHAPPGLVELLGIELYSQAEWNGERGKRYRRDEVGEVYVSLIGFVRD